jgi:putative ABC transport system substrate-binding protein
VTTRREALIAFGAGIAAVSFGVRSQQGRGLPRVALLHPASAEDSAIYKALITGLADFGYVNGRTIALETRSGNGKPEAIPMLVEELVRLNVDVLLVVGPAATKAAIAASHSIPIIAIDLESDPVQNGWMVSLGRPGGNVSGFFIDLTAMAAKWLQLVREAAPNSRNIALLWDSTTGDAQIAATKAAAQALAINVQTARIANWSELDTVLNATIRGGAQTLVVLSSPSAFQFSAPIAAFTNQHRIPAISPFRPFAVAGGLMSYGPDLDLFFRRTAVMVDKILKGARPADVAAEQPTKFELVINLKSAKTLGLTIPQSLLLRADEVIQ